MPRGFNHGLTIRAEQRASLVLAPGLAVGGAGDGPAIKQVLAKAPAMALEWPEHLVTVVKSVTEAEQLALLIPSCHDGNQCQCTQPYTYQIATDVGGRDVILRFRPKTKTERVRQKGACGVGCGQPQPAQPPALYWLYGGPGDVRFIDVPYDAYAVGVTCDTSVDQP